MALWTMNDEEAGKPKYLNDADKAATIGVDVAEAKDAGSIAKGLNTPGWVKYTTYTDAQGNTRNKSEVLVAASSMASDGTATLVDDLSGGGGGVSSTWGFYMSHPEADYRYTNINVNTSYLAINLSTTPESLTALQALPVGTVFTVAEGTGISIGDTFTLTSQFTDQAGWQANCTYSGGGFMGGGMANVTLFNVTTP